MTAAVLLAQAAESTDGVPWYALVPGTVMLVLVVLTMPLWPWSRGWGWNIAGMSATGLFVVGLFTLTWLGS